jgi:hypothetical protein
MLSNGYNYFCEDFKELIHLMNKLNLIFESNIAIYGIDSVLEDVGAVLVYYTDNISDMADGKILLV